MIYYVYVQNSATIYSPMAEAPISRESAGHTTGRIFTESWSSLFGVADSGSEFDWFGVLGKYWFCNWIIAWLVLMPGTF